MLSGRKKSQLTPWLWGLTVAASRNRSSWSGAWAGEWKELCSGPSSRRQSLCSPRPSPGSTPAHAQLLSRVPLCVIPWTVARLAPLSIGFLRQEYWSGCHFLLLGIFLTQGSNLHLLCLLHCKQILNLLSYQRSPISNNNEYFF